MNAAHHMDEELLAMFAEGRLTADEAKEVAGHVADCAPCLQVVRAVNETFRDERDEPWYRTRWLAVAAIVACAVVAGIFVFRTTTRPSSPVARLVELSPREARPVEARLTGGFAWAPYRGPVRATDGAVSAQQMKLTGAAGEIVESAQRNGNADAQHAAGLALVLVQQPEEAIARLEASAKRSNDPKVWTDLGAARYLAASQLGRASLYPTALAAEDKALRIDPNLPEALFNRALILERLGLTEDAKRAWETYLRADPSSPWAVEARSRMAQLPASTQSSQFERDWPLLEAAAERGDTARVRSFVDAHRERVRSYAEGEYLSHWAEALQRNDTGEAARWLSIARGVGDALASISGEALLRDTVSAIAGASPEQRGVIAAAHIDYRRGRIEYSRGQREAAERDFLRSAQGFEATHDPMALEARHYAASTRLLRNDAVGARSDLEHLLNAVNAHPDYLSLGGLVRWELGRAMYYDNDWSQSAAILTEGAALFRRAGERGNEGMIEMILAYALTSLRRSDDAWLARTQAFSALSQDGDPVRLAACVAVAASAEMTAGHRDAALALSATDASIAQGSSRPDTAISGLTNLALLQSISGDRATAMKTAERARELAKTVADPGMRASWDAKVEVTTGAVLAEASPRAATELLTRAIDFYTAHALPGSLLDPLLLRSRCAAREGDVQSAMRDLQRGMSIVESHPATPGMAAGWSVLDAQHAVFTDAIRLSLDGGDKAGAFGFAERLHGGRVSIPELQRRLAGTGTAVIELVALPDELITFAVAENDVVVSRQHTDVEALAPLADESLAESGTDAAAKLYAQLIRPAEELLDHANELMIVADERLSTVPFAALYDSIHRRFLVERFAVAVAANAGALQPDAMRTAAPTAAVIALPTGDADSTVGLPDAEREANEITRLYARTTPLSANSTFAQFRTATAGVDVIHIAGHTERQQGGGEQALLFVGPSGKPERISWKTIIASPLPHDGVVVLAACETLRPSPSAGTHALSLGAAFSAAGASDVIGTLTPIGDRDARLLFDALHRRLASGERPADALRAVQQEAISVEKSSGGHHAWRAIGLLSRRIPAPPRRKELLSWVN